MSILIVVLTLLMMNLLIGIISEQLAQVLATADQSNYYQLIGIVTELE